MDLARMEKKNAGDKYSSVAAVLEDFDLLKSNAYLYNQGTYVSTYIRIDEVMRIRDFLIFVFMKTDVKHDYCLILDEYVHHRVN